MIFPLFRSRNRNFFRRLRLQLKTKCSDGSSSGRNVPTPAPTSAPHPYGKVREMNWVNWTERKHSATVPRTELSELFSQTGDWGTRAGRLRDLNWTELTGRRHLAQLPWIERTFQTNWCLWNWTVLTWCRTVWTPSEKILQVHELFLPWGKHCQNCPSVGVSRFCEFCNFDNVST